MSIPVSELTFETIEYTTNEQIISGILTIMGCFGVIMISAVLTASIKIKGMALYISLLIADLLVCVELIFNGINGLFHKGYSLGPEICVVGATLLLSCCAASILSLLFISMERYYKAKTSKGIKTRHILICISFSWVFSICLSILPLVIGDADTAFSLAPSKIYCTPTWWGNTVVTKCMGLVSLLSALLATGGLLYMYSWLVIRYKKASRKAHATESADDIRKNRTSDEKILLFKAVGVTGTFCFFWIPYFMAATYSLIVERPVPIVIDQICTVLASANSVVSPIILYAFDNRIRNFINDWATTRITQTASWFISIDKSNDS